MSDDDDIRWLREVCDGATPGEWTVCGNDVHAEDAEGLYVLFRGALMAGRGDIRAIAALGTLRGPLLDLVEGFRDLDAWAKLSGDRIPAEMAIRLGDVQHAFDALRDDIRRIRGGDDE